jgi:hypothetical protein
MADDPAGLSAVEARTPERTGVYSFERNAAARLFRRREKLRANVKAAAFFDARPPRCRRAAIHWVTSAKRTETRQRRRERSSATAPEAGRSRRSRSRATTMSEE